MVPKELRYTDQHEWIRVEGDSVVVGITDFAQNALGDVTFVELPPAGKEVAAGDELAAIESAKAAAAIYAPIGGTVVEPNAELEQYPGGVNADPYGRGWICRLKPTNPDELSSLMDADAYRKFLSEKE